LQEKGITARLIDCYSVKPVDRETLRAAAADTAAVITVEDHYPEGGLGDAVAAAVGGLASVHIQAVRVHPHSGTGEELLREQGLDADSLSDLAEALLADAGIR
jgi:transketolase